MKRIMAYLLTFLYVTLFSDIIWESDFGVFDSDFASVNPICTTCNDGGYLLNGQLYYYVDDFGSFEFKSMIIKIDENGNLVWSDFSSFENQEWLIREKGVLEISNNDIITGGIVHSDGFNFGYVTKRDAFGEIIWEIAMNDFLINNLVKIDSTNILFIGLSNNLLSLRKIDVDGNTLWTNSYQINNFNARSINAIKTFDNGFAVNGRFSDNDSFVLKTNSQGDSLWCHYSEDKNNNWLFETSDNNLVVLSNESTKYLNSDGELLEEISFIAYRYYGIDLGNNTFLSTTDSNICIYDYNLNLVSENFNSLGVYCINIPEEGFLFFRNDTFHLTRVNENFVDMNEEELSICYYNLTNFPNPFNPKTTISFSLTDESYIDLSIYNVKGQKIKTVLNEKILKGKYKEEWNGTNEKGNKVSSGVYYCIMKSNNRIIATKKCILLI